MPFHLYHYWRSSSSWRVRWALAIKKIPCAFTAVNLLEGEQTGEAHRKRNPFGAVPVLEITENKKKPKFLAESTAILEWLEETVPEPKLVPGDSFQRARIRQMAQIVNAGIQPLQNLKTMVFYSEESEKRNIWSQHWIQNGFTAYERLEKETAGKFSVGNQIPMADLFLIPQCYNAGRFSVSLEAFPTIAGIYARALETKECQATAPERFKPA